MTRVAIAFSTKDRVELSRQSIEPLVRNQFDLFWCEGSNTPQGEALPGEIFPRGEQWISTHHNVRGGADAAIVFSLTAMLKHPNKYTHVGLVENDVLLDADWFEPTMQLFERGSGDGLEVGAVSARCYEDRILIQRDGYAICHNLGAGMVIFTREAALQVLTNFRTGWWSENRRTFVQLSGIDIGKYAAFRANEQWVTADWHFDTALAQLGLASLALTPSKCQMIGQIPSLAEQGLKLVTDVGDAAFTDAPFMRFRDNLLHRASKTIDLPNQTQFHQHDDGSWLVFPHQINSLSGIYEGDWRLKWSQGYGPFAYRAGGAMADGYSTKEHATLTVPVSGPCSFMVSGGEKGGKVKVEDMTSGYEVTPDLPPDENGSRVLNLVVPSGISYRDVRMTMLTPGCCFYGLQTREQQPWRKTVGFDHSILPPV